MQCSGDLIKVWPQSIRVVKVLFSSPVNQPGFPTSLSIGTLHISTLGLNQRAISAPTAKSLLLLCNCSMSTSYSGTTMGT